MIDTFFPRPRIDTVERAVEGVRRNTQQLSVMREFRKEYRKSLIDQNIVIEQSLAASLKERKSVRDSHIRGAAVSNSAALL